MDNWNDATPRRAGQRPADDCASGGDLSAVRWEYQAQDYRLIVEVYAEAHCRIGPPPLGAFSGHQAMGRRAPGPSSVDTGWEDAPKLIPAAKQQPAAGAVVPAENRSCANGTVSGTGSTSGRNDSEGGEKGSAGGERGGGFSVQHPSVGQGGVRRPGAQGLGSATVGRGCCWREPAPAPGRKPDAPKFIPAAKQQPAAGSTRDESGGMAAVPAENRRCANGTVSGTGSTSGRNDSEGGCSGENCSAGGERGGGFSASHPSVGQGGERRPGAQGLGSATVWRGCCWREPGRKRPSPAVRNREGVDGMYVPPVYSGGGRGDGGHPRHVGSGRAPEGGRDRGRMVQEGGGSGPVERGAENCGAEGRRDAASCRRKKMHKASCPKLWRGGSSRGCAEQPRAAGGREATEAAAASDHGLVSNDRKTEEEGRSQKREATDGGTSSPRNHSAQSRGEEGATDLDRREQLSAQLWSGSLDCLVCWEPLRPQDPVWSCQDCDNVLHLACAQRRVLSGQDGEEGATALDRREQLSAQLLRGSLDCLVCWEPLRPQDPVWSCQACYNVLHLACARRWAFSPLGGSGGWPCPACRHEEPRVFTEYRCWCGKRRDPDPDRGPSRVPHSCGEECGKPRGCDHRCALRCHPGPCPPCNIQFKRWCDCGRKRLLVACGQQKVCGAVCGLPLSCGRHFCERTCHPVPCDKCQLLRTVVCWCGSKTRQVPCDSDEAPANGFACNLVCGRVLVRGNFQAIERRQHALTTFIKTILVLICLYDFFFLPLEKKIII